MLRDVVAVFPADLEPFHPVVPGDRAFHDPSDGAKAGAVGLAAAGDAGGGRMPLADISLRYLSWS
jgi:hypothetical protein